MAFTRTQMVAAVAGTLSLAVLTGCPASPAGTTPSPAASASMAPSVAPSAAASMAATTTPSAAASSSVAPSVAPSAAGSADPSALPSPVGPPPSGEKVIVSGNVYDEEGATVDGALVTVKSLVDSVPYTATASTSQGSWVVNNVPEGANVEIIATKGGWTSRRRVGSFQKQATGKRNVIDFGAAGGKSDSNDDDPTGEAYFISDYPEIVSTEPKTDATGVDNQKLSFKIRLSEALDEDSRDTLVQALTILPANAEANGAALAASKDLETLEDDNEADGVDGIALTDYEYKIEEGSTFLGNSDRDVTATWNAEGTELTFAFDATLLADDNDEAKYQAVLVSQGTAADDLIEDEDGNQLGTNNDGSLKNYPAKDSLISNAFKEIDLSADDAAGASKIGENNWVSTHDSAANWEIKRDEVDPKLTAVDVSKDVDGDFRIELTFSEGMAAFNGDSAGASDITDLRDLENNFRFALGDKVGDTEDVDLSDKPTLTGGPGGRIIDARAGGNFTTAGSFGDDDAELEDDFTFLNASVNTVAANIDAVATPGQILVEVDDNNPNTVFIWIKDRANLFANKASEIKAYVDSVADPAGNAISDNDAEKNQVRGTI